MHPRALALLLAAAVLAPLPASSVTSSATPSAKPGPDHHRPDVGACYDYGIRGLLAISGPRREVSCDDSHRAVTVAVPGLTGDIDRKNPLAAFDQIGTRCYRALYRALGGTQESRALTAYGLSFYIPTQDELDRGARWVRCDMLLLGGNKLMPLPDPLLTATPDDSVALCLPDEVARATVCAREHRYRATGVVAVKGDTYPGEAKLNRMGQRRCDTRTTSGRYLWRYPSALSWRAGRHVITCFTKTRD